MSGLYTRNAYSSLDMNEPTPRNPGWNGKKKKKKGSIAEIMHPDYRVLITDYNKWRLTYLAGRRFIWAYLKRHSKRETPQEFLERKAMTYCPSFAKAAINEVMNSIYQRLSDIRRVGGDQTYIDGCKGENGGVDLHGSSMANFMGQSVLRELLPMKKVGIYVDMPKLSGETVLDSYRDRPYVYLYPAEDIRTWSYQYQNGQYQYNNVLLRDAVQEVDPETGMPIGTQHRFRRVWLDTDGVHIKFYTLSGDSDGEEIVLPKLKRIPFITVELSDSLLVDIADYQIALLNLHSTDLAYMVKNNFAFYTEEYEPRADNFYTEGKPVNGESITGGVDGQNSKEIVVGNVSGRRYPKGFKTPQFIAPPVEPIELSMKKEQQMKDEMRQLIGLAVSTLTPQHASAPSKAMDQGSLESGLSVIGLTMEYAEREIAKIWGMYLGNDESDCATVNYPVKYALLSEDDRRKNVTLLSELQAVAPSVTYKKELGKQIAHCLLERKVDAEVLEKINNEIDAAPYIDGTALAVQGDVAAGIVSAETAAAARGYSNPAKEVETAKKEAADKLAVIAQHQQKAVQGVPETQPPGGANKKPDGTPMNPGAGRPPVE